jgi:hypothetical protein
MPANTQVQNVKLGACDVNYDSVDLGLTKGGVQVNITTTKHEVKVDQFGETIANDIIMGRQGTVTVPMAETDLTKLAKVIPGATLVTDTTDVANKADDVTVPLAGVSGDIQFAFQVDQERVYNVTFTMYPDEDGLLLIFGDETAVAA